MHANGRLITIIFISFLLSACARKEPAPFQYGTHNQTRKAYEEILSMASRTNYTRKKEVVASYPSNPAPKKVLRTNKYIIVEKGDTAYSIARGHEIPIKDLLEANNLQPPYSLTPGQKLVIPSDKNYVVKNGDTLYSISRDNNIPLNSLITLNDIKPPYHISEGQELNLPAYKSTNFKTPVVKKSNSTSKKLIPKRSYSKFAKPVNGKIISSFGSKNNGLHNDGINIAAKKGAPVKAAENGMVVYSSAKIKGLGNIILIKHDSAWITAYAHLDKRLVVEGDVVKRGSTIGTVGNTGSVTSPQLHFEIRKSSKPLDPQQYMN